MSVQSAANDNLVLKMNPWIFSRLFGFTERSDLPFVQVLQKKKNTIN